MSLQLTAEQRAVVEHRPAVGDVVAVKAVAGAGKSTTIYEWAARLAASGEGRVLYLAFNRAVVDDAGARVAGHPSIDVTTFSSLAYTDRARAGYDICFEQDLNAATDLYPHCRAVPWLCRAAVDMLRAFSYSSDAAPNAATHAPRFNGNRTELAQTAMRLWDAIVVRRCRCPFWAAEKLFSAAMPALPYRWVLVDEGQDMNPCMLAMVVAQRTHAAVAIVGDPYQQIYEFRGTVNAFALISPSAEFRLTHSQRWGAQIGNAATALLRGAASRPPAYTIHGLYAGPTTVSGLPAGTPIGVVPASMYTLGACPCQMWAPAHRPCPPAMALLARSVRGTLEAAVAMARCPHRDGHAMRFADFEAVAAEMRRDLPVFTANPTAYLSTDASVAASIGRQPVRMGQYGPMYSTPQKFVAKYLGQAAALWAEIEALGRRGLAADQGEAALLRATGVHAGDDERTRSPVPRGAAPVPLVVSVSTTHRCKGLQFDHVLMWNDFKPPTRPTPELDEEVNITYVAITRTRIALMIPSKISRLCNVTATAAARPRAATTAAKRATTTAAAKRQHPQAAAASRPRGTAAFRAALVPLTVTPVVSAAQPPPRAVLAAPASGAHVVSAFFPLR